MCVWLGCGIVVVAGVAFVLFWFQPQKLFIDDRVEEPIPVVAVADPPASSTSADANAASPSAPPSTARPEPVEIARGEFVSLDHGTSGVARVLELADGRRVVRLEGLDTSTVPICTSTSTPTPAAGEEGGVRRRATSTSVASRATKAIRTTTSRPAPTSPGSRPCVIWCDRFDSAFGAADLITA